MGSFCKPSKQTSTSSQTSSTAPPDYIADAYKRLLPQLESAAATPWDPNTQQQVAGFSAPQMQGFQGVQNMQGAYQPYMNAAGAYTGLGALPVTASVGNYMNPFISNVVDASMNDWQEMSRRRMQDVNSNAAKVGALTGDRSQVAQQLAREASDSDFARNIAGLYSQGYTQALGAAQTDAARALQAGQQFGALGGLAQQYGYADVNALMGIGGMQQGLQQQQYDAGTQNAMARAQYPFQSAQWLTGNLTGLGSAAGSTSTGTGKQTTPGPSMFQQVAGLGVAALGAFAKGGRVGYADGGTLPYGKGLSYVPSVQVSSRGLQASPLPEMSKAAPASSGMDSLLSNYQQAKSAIEGGQKLGSWLRTTNDPDSGWSTTVNPSGASGWGNYLGSMFKGFGFSHGGRVGYADGGEVDEGWGDDDYDAFYGEGSVVGTSPMAPPPVSVGVVPPAQARAVVALPEERKPTPGLLGLNFSDPVRRGLMTAGFGMLASTSPNFGVALGQGGLAGVKAYNDALSEDDEIALKRSALATKAMTEAQRSAIAQSRVDAAEEANRIRQAQIEAMMPYRNAQIENMRSLAEQREFKKRLLESLGMGGAAAETTEGGVQSQSNLVMPGAPTVQPAADVTPVTDGAGRFANPNITPVDDRPAPETAAPAPASPDTMITLPNGKKLTPEEAQRMGMGLLLDPDTAALGKYLMEQAQAKIGGSSSMGQPAKNMLEEKTINTAEQLARLEAIDKKFDPKYLTMGEQVGNWWNGIKAKVMGGDVLNDDDKQRLIDITAFRADAITNINNYIKEITGAAMAVTEANRIMMAQPNPGMSSINGLFDGDDPVSFKSKLDAAKKNAKLALYRHAHLRKYGLGNGQPLNEAQIRDLAKSEKIMNVMPLEEMNKILGRRALEIKNQILRQNPKLQGADVNKLVWQSINQEYGV